jgi:hypothetical protein
VNNQNRGLFKEAKRLEAELQRIRQAYAAMATPVSEEVKAKREEIISALEDDIRRLREKL